MSAGPDLMSRLLTRQPANSRQTLPLVSVVTPTWNRRTFLPYLLYMFQYQDYPAERRELVILDDSEQSNADLIDSFKKYASHPESIRYYHQTERLTLGQKRNRLNQLAQGEYLICMDDDDFYPPEKISYTIAEMQRHNALFAGCDSIPIWYSHINRIYLSPSLGVNHALNGTFACHRHFLRKHRYDDSATLAEEDGFLNNFTVPVLQLDPARSILCISHNANTFDKDFVLGSAERAVQPLEMIVTDSHLRKFYQRLYQAPISSQINWEFFTRIVVINQSGDNDNLATYLAALRAQGVTPQQLDVIHPVPGQPLAYSHLLAAQQAQRAGWQNYLLLDDRTSFVRQQKTVDNLNQLLAACRVLEWQVLLLGCALENAYPLQTLPGAVKVTRASQPVAYAVHQASLPPFIAMLEQTLVDQRAAPATDPCQQQLQWQPLSEQGRWFALYPSYLYRDTDDAGQSLAHQFFRKLNTHETN